MRIRLTEEEKIRVLNGKDLYGVMQRVLLRERKIDRGKEHCWVVALNARQRILLIELVGLGTTDAVVAEPVDIFSFALQKQATKIILVHNHPSGEVDPSAADKTFTQRMIAVGKLVRCEVIDHLIITEKTYYSFAHEGLLYELATTAVDLTFAEVDRLQKLYGDVLSLYRKDMEQRDADLAEKDRQLAEAKKESEQKASILALALLADGFDVEKVAQLTNLSPQKVRALIAKAARES